ncbi:ATP-binding cassette domain-containing protein [Marinomonas transparens]|uniref:Flp pilus assembly complex ATPase component TadA n=1 Tax=Marinomonas transparens TaxID=2795388 RepID=A0A934JWH8_9GAMM|nr:Flp pilus assembly complex ATPase component TadA [Marinomonas transparens]MBJ7539661.1 Flp pilus assembly complex ATPase component TadA [Marinomonas transparens]
MTASNIHHLYNNSTYVQTALNKIQSLLNKPQRTLIGLTGGPGSGKSTLASYLATQVTKQSEQIVCLSMDGFHLSKTQLSALPNAEQAFARRGAPWTFDSAAFIERVGRIRHAFQQEDILWPSFDHALGDPVENDVCIAKNAKVVLVEGLYLLHQQDGWQASKPLFDEHWFLDVPLNIAIERLAQRHMAAWGFSHAQAMERIEQSDGLNAELVARYRDQADWLLRV